MASGAQDSRMEASCANRVPLASDKRSARAAQAADLLEPEDHERATTPAHGLGQARKCSRPGVHWLDKARRRSEAAFFNGRKINLSHVFAGQNVGVTQVG